MSIDAMKRALEALEGLRDLFYQETIDALRAAIEAAEKQEPIAWKDTMHTDHADGRKEHEPMLLGYDGWEKLPDGTDLYTTLPQPAIPEGYALVPVKLPREVETSIWMEGFNDVSDAWECFLRKLAAAPKPENSHD